MICHVLTVIFTLSNLFGIIDWSWWVVFAPSIVRILFNTLVLMVIIGIAYKKEKDSE